MQITQILKILKIRIQSGGILRTLCHYNPISLFLRLRKNKVVKNLLPRRNDHLIHENKRLRVFSFVWGEPYTTWFLDGVLRSFSWDKNLPLLKRKGYSITFSIMTKEPNELEEKFRQHQIYQDLKSIIKFELHDLNKIKKKGEDPKITAVLNHIKACVDENAIGMIAPADIFYGNGSISNACLQVERKDVCIAFPPFRVREGCFGEFTHRADKGPLTSPQLVSLAFKNPHHTWKNFFNTVEPNLSESGVSLIDLGENLYSMIHVAPTIFLARFDISDYEYFNLSGTFNEWDRGWFSKKLLETKVKVLGSSDLFFCIEITEDEINKDMIPSSPSQNDQVPQERISFQSQVMNQFVISLRGED